MNPLTNNSFDVKIKRIKTSGIIVECPDGSEGWLPADEWSYDRGDWIRDRPSLKAGNIERVVKWGKTFHDSKSALSRRRVECNPWANVTQEWMGQAKPVIVTRLTKKYAIGEIESGLEAKLEFKAFDDYITQRDGNKFWRIHSRIALNDCVAGIVEEIHWPGKFNEPLIILNPAKLLENIEADPNVLVSQAQLVAIPNPHFNPTGPEIYNRAPDVDHIFILDNDINFLDSVAEVLEGSGYKVTKASSEIEALAKLESFDQDSIQLALIDLHLLDDQPAHDGLNVAKQIANDMPNCKIILLSGEDIGLEHKERLQKFNDCKDKDIVLADYVQKPLTIRQLHEKIAQAAAGQTKDFETLCNELIDETDTTNTMCPVARLNEKGIADEGRYSMEKSVNELGRQLLNVVVHVFQMHPESYSAKSIAHYGNSLRLERIRHKLPKSPVRDTAVDPERSTWLCDDVGADVRMQRKHYWLLKAMQYRSALGIPIRAISEYGYCLLVFHPEPDKFTPEFQTEAHLCAERVGRALEWEWFTKRSEDRARFETAGMAFVCLSHEIRNDLSALSAQTEVLEGLLQKHIDGTAFGKEVVKKAVHLKAIIERTIKISQTLGGMQTSNATEDLNVIECLHEAIKAVRTQIPHGKEIEVKQTSVTEEYIVRGNRARLIPALFNLLLNAVQQISLFVRSKGLIWFEFSLHHDDDGNWLKMDIHDSGPGIHAADFNKIFNVGYSTKPKGTGMGLHICRQDISAIGDGHRSGRVEVAKSTLCIGTTFSVYLPIIRTERKEI